MKGFGTPHALTMYRIALINLKSLNAVYFSYVSINKAVSLTH